MTFRTKRTGETVSTRLRLPKELHLLLVENAKHNHRSLNSEMVYRLAFTLGAEGTAVMLSVEAEARKIVQEVFAAAAGKIQP